MDHKIKITRLDGKVAGFSLLSLTFREGFEDLSSKLSLKVSKGHEILDDSRVTYWADGALKLIGQVDNIDDNSSEYSLIEISSAESLFSFRPCQPYVYPDGTVLTSIISDQPPTTGGRVGLIYWMNSGLDPAWSVYSGYIYKLPGGGTGRLGSGDLYENDVKLTRVTSLGAVTAGKFYQNSTDLYVWTTTNVDPCYRLMSMPNWRDTMVRLGTIENGSSFWSVPYKIEDNHGLNEIVGLLWAKYQEVKFEPNADGYVYLTSKSQISRGSEASPRKVFKHGTRGVNKITCDIAMGQARANSVVALGSGQGASRQRRAVADLATTKIGQVWRSEILDATAFRDDALTNLASKTLDEKRDNKVYVVGAKADWGLRTGDYIKIVPQHSIGASKRIIAISYKWPENTMEIEAGRRQITFTDAFKKRLEALRVLSTMAQSVSTEWSEWFDGNVDDAHPLTVQFNLASGKLDENQPYTFKLRLSVDWFKSPTQGVTTVAHDNGGYAGGHTGYGGNDTSEEIQTAHDLGNFTSAAVEPYSQYLSNVSQSWHGHHSTYGDDNDTWVEVLFDLTPTFDYACADADYESLVGLSASFGWVSDAGHTHAIGEEWDSDWTEYVPSIDHLHRMPAGQKTDDAGEQAHGTDHEAAQPRTIGTEPDTPATVSAWLQEHQTGNSYHMLDFYITLNGVAIPGSPFPDLFPGENIDDADMAALVNRTGNNVLIIAVKDHDAPLTEPVRCSVNGSISAEYYITEY